MRLSVDPASGRVRLTLPPRASLKRAMAWAEEHRDWIAAQCERLPRARPFVPGATIPIAGEEVVIDWEAGRPRTITFAPPRRRPGSSIEPPATGPRPSPGWDEEEARLLCGGPLEGLARRIETWLKRHALAVLTQETAEYAAKAGVTIARVSVADAKARWGSCASSGAIRYNWRLICAPPDVRRATVAHEVAHRLEMNHSPAFYAHLRRLYGADPAPARAWLKRHGAELHWIGAAGNSSEDVV
ncbi:MAG: M48 family metallopeptidase [Sphingomonas sp.]|uniref:M48 family metallopeptidase n=1 Tax=Sphingomonas sp. TaxID=28214 RepID=UPI001ACC6DD1|nr:SprT family zinc-dependent metalloprotease [Sphingomonas sp.]MBN8808799.1 M48 family metallopeptidase [Sphingomonas sp.]